MRFGPYALAASTVLGVLTGALATPVTAMTWPPLDPAALADTASRVEPGADAEILLWTITSQQNDYADDATRFEDHFLRTKVFNARGLSDRGTVTLPVPEDAKLTDLAARTIAPDGTVREVTPREIHDVVLLRAGGFRIRNRSFAFPGAVPGSVLDLSYRMTTQRAWFSSVEILPAQVDLPIRRLELEFVPPPGNKYGVHRTVAVGAMSDLAEVRPGHFRTVLTDLPSYHEEPDIVSDFTCRSWIVGETQEVDASIETYWELAARALRSPLRLYVEPPEAVHRATVAAVAGATSPEETFAKIDEWVRENVLDVETLPESASALRQSFKPNERPWDALRKKLGTGRDLDLLLYLMARDAGLEPRLAYSSGRWNAFLDFGRQSRRFLTQFLVAIRTPSGWLFADPASRVVPPGGAPASDEGQTFLFSNSRDSLFARAPFAPPERSRLDRIATVQMAADGSAEVVAREVATGHVACSLVQQELAEVPAESLQAEFRTRWPECTVTDATSEVTSRGGTIVTRHYRVHVPHYATSAGKRWLVPAFWFTKGMPRRYPEPVRRYPLAIDYAWCGTDSVTVEAPPGLTFEFTAPESPAVFPWGRYEASLATSPDGRALVAVRSARVGDAPVRVYPAFVYPSVRAADERRARWNDALAIARAKDPGKP